MSGIVKALRSTDSQAVDFCLQRAADGRTNQKSNDQIRRLMVDGLVGGHENDTKNNSQCLVWPS